MQQKNKNTFKVFDKLVPISHAKYSKAWPSTSLSFTAQTAKILRPLNREPFTCENSTNISINSISAFPSNIYVTFLLDFISSSPLTFYSSFLSPNLSLCHSFFFVRHATAHGSLKQVKFFLSPLFLPFTSSSPDTPSLLSPQDPPLTHKTCAFSPTMRHAWNWCGTPLRISEGAPTCIMRSPAMPAPTIFSICRIPGPKG